MPGLDAVPLPAGAVITLPIDDPSALGRAFVVQSPQRLYVERLLPRGGRPARPLRIVRAGGLTWSAC